MSESPPYRCKCTRRRQLSCRSSKYIDLSYIVAHILTKLNKQQPITIVSLAQTTTMVLSNKHTNNAVLIQREASKTRAQGKTKQRPRIFPRRRKAPGNTALLLLHKTSQPRGQTCGRRAPRTPDWTRDHKVTRECLAKQAHRDDELAWMKYLDHDSTEMTIQFETIIEEDATSSSSDGSPAEDEGEEIIHALGGLGSLLEGVMGIPFEATYCDENREHPGTWPGGRKWPSLVFSICEE